MDNNELLQSASFNRQELSSLLNRYAEKINHETIQWAEDAKKDARNRAELEGRCILAKAQEEASSIMEKTRAEAAEVAAAALKDAEFLKRQAQEQMELWLKEKREAMAIQLREICAALHKEMLAQSEALKRRTTFFEVDFEKQITSMLDEGITIYKANENAFKPNESLYKSNENTYKSVENMYKPPEDQTLKVGLSPRSF
jgi:cell division septum initiation protein DivIVA